MGKPPGRTDPEESSLIDLDVQPHLKEQRNAVVLVDILRRPEAGLDDPGGRGAHLDAELEHVTVFV
jgi:hypothetical protein